MNSPTADVMGEIGLSMPVSELEARTWDVIVVGAGHNGLACSAYLAKAGLRVLVIESMPRRGFEWIPAVNGLFVPFLDGTSIQLWDDDERCVAEVRALSPGDVDGWKAMNDVIRRLRDALRPAPLDGLRGKAGWAQDLWVGDAPSREEIE
jgi:phytoene dehydrogenase-like protein